MTSDGECSSCGSLLFLRAYLGVDGTANFALICPNCDQIESDDHPISRDEPVDLGEDPPAAG